MLRTLSLFSAILIAWSPAAAKKKKKAAAPASEHVVAVFLVPRDNPNAKLLGALNDELTKSAGAGIKVVAGKALKKLIKKKPDAAILKCGSNVSCVAKLGKQAHADEVLYGRVAPAGGGIKAQFLVVGVASSAIERKLSVELDAVATVASTLESKHADIWGAAGAVAAAPAPAGGDEDEPSLDMIAGTSLMGEGEAKPAEGETPALASAESASAPPAESGEAASPAAETGQAAAEPAPSGGGDLELAELPTGPTAKPTDPELAALPATEVATPIEVGGRSRKLTWAGVGVAGIGVVALGLGAMSEMKAKSLHSSVEHGPGGTTQTKAVGIFDDEKAAVKRGNLFLAAGSATVVVGAALAALDIFVLGKKTEADTQVTVGASGAGAWVRWDF